MKLEGINWDEKENAKMMKMGSKKNTYRMEDGEIIRFLNKMSVQIKNQEAMKKEELLKKENSECHANVK